MVEGPTGQRIRSLLALLGCVGRDSGLNGQQKSEFEEGAQNDCTKDGVRGKKCGAGRERGSSAQEARKGRGHERTR